MTSCCYCQRWKVRTTASRGIRAVQLRRLYEKTKQMLFPNAIDSRSVLWHHIPCREFSMWKQYICVSSSLVSFVSHSLSWWQHNLLSSGCHETNKSPASPLYLHFAFFHFLSVCVLCVCLFQSLLCVLCVLSHRPLMMKKRKMQEEEREREKVQSQWKEDSRQHLILRSETTEHLDWMQPWTDAVVDFCGSFCEMNFWLMMMSMMKKEENDGRRLD